MIRDCNTHGFFDGHNCPACNNEGKFIMSDRERDILGRRMAGILRHFPEKFDLDMDINGWVDVREMVEALRNRDRRMHWLRPPPTHIQLKSSWTFPQIVRQTCSISPAPSRMRHIC